MTPKSAPSKLAYMALYRARNRDRINASIREWRLRNVDRKRESRRVWYWSHRDEFLKRIQAERRGVTPETIAAIRLAQGDLCAICQKPFPTDRAPSVDHDHNTRALRGILCRNCNTAIGLMRDDPDTLDAAASYLRRHKEAAS